MKKTFVLDYDSSAPEQDLNDITVVNANRLNNGFDVVFLWTFNGDAKLVPFFRGESNTELFSGSADKSAGSDWDNVPEPLDPTPVTLEEMQALVRREPDFGGLDVRQLLTFRK